MNTLQELVMRPHPLALVVMGGALVGLLFASFSTYDFAQHLDRQVHSVHCSFVPGLAATDTARTSGCAATLMSPYSSVLRTWIWGGIPISLPAMSVFAFLLFVTAEVILGRRQDDPRATGFLALAAVVPAAASLVMALISLRLVGATCKLCMAMYLGSALCLVGAFLLWRRAAGGASAPPRKPARDITLEGAAPAPGRDPAWAKAAPSADEGAPLPAKGFETTALAPASAPSRGRPRVSHGYLGAACGIGVLFVLLPVAIYAAAAPDHERFLGTCGSLEVDGDGDGVLIPLDENRSGVPAIEVLDPLCPACRSFDARLEASGLDRQLHRRALIFPLDSTCNWMVDDAIHPGACAVSEAVLCAEGRAAEVLAWAFSEQEAIMKAERATAGAAAELVAAQFPELSRCVGSPEAKNRLNRSLRWAVDNHLAVLTPQLFIAGTRLCDEDTDLGLDFALSRLLDRHARGGLTTPSRDDDAPEVNDLRRPEAEDMQRPEAEASREPEVEDKGRPEADDARRPEADAPADPAPDEEEAIEADDVDHPEADETEGFAADDEELPSSEGALGETEAEDEALPYLGEPETGDEGGEP
jgi:uncharacterized membrane protein